MTRTISNIKHYASNRFRAVVVFFVLFYVAGALGILIPATRNIFSALIPFALLLSVAGLWLYHQPSLQNKSLLIFGLVYFSGLLVEIIGVNTGKIFGSYHYGSALGPKIFETPLLIGLNWLMLAYCFASVLQKLQLTITLKVIMASVAMVCYDWLLEKVAPALDMWHWTDGAVPLQNYIAWFAISALFSFLLIRLKTYNPLAITIVICQFAFFVTLAIFL